MKSNLAQKNQVSVVVQKSRMCNVHIALIIRIIDKGMA